ncbi:MAG: hypothetical protein LC777_01010 [Actinobacteria bacterium]|nr:hypothetical protein [Actinomycetota bacterium]
MAGTTFRPTRSYTTLRDVTYSISWTADELAEMITARLPDHVTVADILDPENMRQSTAPFAYVVQPHSYGLEKSSST